jgi:hypothetical protein
LQNPSRRIAPHIAALQTLAALMIFENERFGTHVRNSRDPHCHRPLLGLIHSGAV